MWEVSDGTLFPDEPEYDIEILEWIVEEDYTVEWEYVWGVKLKELFSFGFGWIY